MSSACQLDLVKEDSWCMLVVCVVAELAPFNRFVLNLFFFGFVNKKN